MNTATKTRKNVKNQPKQQHKLPVIAGPLVILHGPSSREILTLIRDSINIALGESMRRPVQQNTVPTTSEPLVNSWHGNPDTARTQYPARRGYMPAPATSPAKQKSFRSRIVEWITDYVGPREAGRTDDNYRIAYKEAYRQLMLRHGFDVEQRARNFARKYIQKEQPVPAGNEPMDFVERLNMTEELFKIVCEMYPLNAVDPMMRSEPVLAGAQGLQG
jgi:hypothetical protein